MQTKKSRKKSFIEHIILISLESLTRRYKRILYWHMYKSLKHIHVSVAFTCSFIIITQMAQSMYFFALNQWVLDSKLANEWHEKFCFCESMRQQFLCRIFHVLKYKWSPFLASFLLFKPFFLLFFSQYQTTRITFFFMPI